MATTDTGDLDELAAGFRPSWEADAPADPQPPPPAAAKAVEALEPEATAPFDASKTIPDGGPSAIPPAPKPLDGKKTLPLGAEAPKLDGNRTAPLGAAAPKLDGVRTAPLAPSAPPPRPATAVSPARARPMAPSLEGTEELQALVMKRSNKGLVFAGVGVVAVIGLIVAVKFAVSSSPDTPKVEATSAAAAKIPESKDIPPPPEATEAPAAPVSAAPEAPKAPEKAEPTAAPEPVAAKPEPKPAPAPPPPVAKPAPAPKPVVAAARPAPAPRPAPRPAAAPAPAPAPKAPPKPPSGGIVRDNPF